MTVYYMTKFILENSPKPLLTSTNKNLKNKMNHLTKKDEKIEELVNLKPQTPHLSDDTKVIKETTTNFYSKLT